MASTQGLKGQDLSPAQLGPAHRSCPAQPALFLDCLQILWPIQANLGRVNKQILTKSQCTKFKAFWFNWNTFSIKISLFEKLNQIILFKNIYQFIQQDYLVALGKLIYLVAFCFWNQIGRDRGRDLIKFDILSPIFKQMFHQKSKCK